MAEAKPAPAEPKKSAAEKDKEEESDDEIPDLENAPPADAAAAEASAGGADAGDAGSKQNRGEKKNRKALAKLGLKPVSGVQRVTVKRPKQPMIVIVKPDVFKSPTSDTYVIFGEVKGQTEDASRQAYDQLMQQASAAGITPSAAAGARAESPPPALVAAPGAAPSAITPPASSAAAAAPDEPVDETGVDPKDIELVMAQTNASRARAVKALKNKKNDIVEAIIELTVS